MLGLAFFDLRFEDGHVERWLGSGLMVTFASAPAFLAQAEEWGRDVLEEAGDVLRGEICMDYSNVPRWEDAPYEVVVEWNAEGDW